MTEPLSTLPFGKHSPQLLPSRGDTDPFSTVRTALERRGSKISNAKRDEFMATCPVHSGGNESMPSLHVTRGRDRVLLHCHAGCETPSIIETLGLEMSDLFERAHLTHSSGIRSAVRSRPPKPETKDDPADTILIDHALKRWGKKDGKDTVYDYVDEAGEVAYWARRIPTEGGGKRFTQGRYGPSGGMLAGLQGISQIPYGLPELTKYPDAAIHLTEGEKDTNALRKHGVLAVSLSDAAVSDDNLHHFRDRHIVIHEDHDTAGAKKADRRAAWLYPTVASVRLMTYHDLPEKGDVSDWLAIDGHSIDDLIATMNRLPAWQPGDGANDREREWPEPIPFQPMQGPPFPTEALPGTTGDYVMAVAASIGVPVDLAAVVALGTISAAVGGRYSAGHHKYREPVHIMTIGVAPPASRKSGVFAAMLSPLEEWVNERNVGERSQLAEWESARRALQAELTRAESPPKRGEGVEPENRDLLRRAAVVALAEHDDAKPVITEIRVDDITPQAASERLITQGGSLAVMSAETAFLENIAGRYDKSGGSDLNLFLQGHAGDAHKVSRKGSESGYVSRACLTLCILMQPEALMNTGGMAGFHGRGGSARLLPAIPAPNVGYRAASVDARDVPPALTYHWHQKIRTLLKVSHSIDAAEPVSLHLSPDALDDFTSYERECEYSLRTITGHMAAWVGKLHGATLRLAGLLHLVEHEADEQISSDTMRHAITVARWFHAHAEIMYRMMDADGSENDAERLYDWLRSRGIEQITAADIWRKVRFWSGWNLTRLDNAIDALAEHYLVVYEEAYTGKGTGKASKLVYVSPKTPTLPARPLPIAGYDHSGSGGSVGNSRNPYPENRANGGDVPAAYHTDGSSADGTITLTNINWRSDTVLHGAEACDDSTDDFDTSMFEVD